MRIVYNTAKSKYQSDRMFEPYYEKPRFKLYLADCLAVLAGIEENSVDMVFADPPYFLSSGSFTCQSH